MDDEALLALWESALGCNAWQREDVLVAAATSGSLPLSLGERNAALLRWRRRYGGRVLPLRATCPRCAAELDFALDTEALCANGESARAIETLQLGSRRVSFRLPTSDEVRGLASLHRDVDSLATALLECCIVEIDGEARPTTHGVDDELRTAIVERMEALDPRASLGVALRCMACAHEWEAPLDVAAMLWPELRRRAEQVLLDVAALARAFGWAERDVLRMSATRRGAYLQLAGAA
jgi:hypothetical protein